MQGKGNFGGRQSGKCGAAIFGSFKLDVADNTYQGECQLVTGFAFEIADRVQKKLREIASHALLLKKLR
jgi:hypothetical protein